MNRRNPFDALGLPTDPDLTDDQIHAAWREIAAATHPDRPDGGDLPRYTAASAACTELSTRWGRTEAYADMIEELWATAVPLPPIALYDALAPVPLTARLRMLPGRIWHSRRLRLAIRATAAAVDLLAGADEPPQPRPRRRLRPGPAVRPGRPAGPGTAAPPLAPGP